MILAATLATYALLGSVGSTVAIASAQAAPSQAAPQQNQTSAPATSPVPDTKKPSRRHKTKPAPASATPDKKIVREGGASDRTEKLSPESSNQQVKSKTQTTAQLLDATDANLKRVANRHLSSSQQDTVAQIHKFVEQAKAASDAGDLERAQNLAFKARQLSDELSSH